MTTFFVDSDSTVWPQLLSYLISGKYHSMWIPIILFLMNYAHALTRCTPLWVMWYVLISPDTMNVQGKSLTSTRPLSGKTLLCLLRRASSQRCLWIFHSSIVQSQSCNLHMEPLCSLGFDSSFCEFCYSKVNWRETRNSKTGIQMRETWPPWVRAPDRSQHRGRLVDMAEEAASLAGSLLSFHWKIPLVADFVL